MMYFGLTRTARGLCEAPLTVEVDSRWERVVGGRVGRGDFLVIDGDRLVFLLNDSVTFEGCGVVGVSIFVGLPDVFGLPHANLMAHCRFGASDLGAVEGAAWCTTGAGLETGLFFPTH